MTRNALNFVVDLLTFLVLAGIAATGLVMRYVLPPGMGGLHLLGWGRHDWGGLHFWLAAVLGVLLVVHLALHWSWVCATVSRWVRFGGSVGGAAWKRNAVGCVLLGGAAASAVGFVWLARAGVESGGGAGFREGAGRGGCADACEVSDGASTTTGDQDGGCAAEKKGGAGRGGATGRAEGIRGSMTLQEAAGQSGICVNRLRGLLKLPDEVPADARLGPMMQKYSLSMADVRKAVAEAGRTACEGER